MKSKNKYMKKFWIAEGCFIISILIILFSCYADYTFFMNALSICVKALAVGTGVNLLLCYIFAKQHK
ncbi:hypothetical protein M2140_001096 [Clostridiales Family XIII bacterium PM5-7]